MSEGNKATITSRDYYGKGKDWTEDCYSDFARTSFFWLVKAHCGEWGNNA